MADINKKIDSMIKKKKWDKIFHGIDDATPETRKKIVEACSECTFEEVGSTLFKLMDVEYENIDKEPGLLINVINTMGVLGNSRAATALHNFRSKLKPEYSNVLEAARSAITEIRRHDARAF